jgi:hypothetical protein
MSDEWIFFPCQMGEHSASIFFDHGIRESIDNTVPSRLLKVRVAFKHPRPDGMPTNEEFQSLNAFEDALQALVQQQESTYVGRVTVDGHRHFYIYTSDSEDAWSSRLDALGRSHGYSLAYAMKTDDGHGGYWQELYPTEDDWQVIQDLRVIQALAEQGDDGTTPRSIDHWAYFPSQIAAERFSHWAQEQGYGSLATDIADDGKFRVRFAHEGTVRLGNITSHTIKLRRKASEVGGEYDGWETPVCKT